MNVFCIASSFTDYNSNLSGILQDRIQMEKGKSNGHIPP